MYWTIKEKGDYNHMVWRNGKGKSTQIHIEPSNFTLNDPFTWRISQAVVGCAGPFSSFEGYNRTLLILKGNKLSLFHRQKPNESIDINYFEPYNFNGGWETDSIFLPNEYNYNNNANDNTNNNIAIEQQNNNFLTIQQLNSKLSISPNSPITPSTLFTPTLSCSNSSIGCPQKEETYDFSVISKESEIKHTVEVISFDKKFNPDDDDVFIDDDQSSIQHKITIDPLKIEPNSTLVFYCYNLEAKFTHHGDEKSKMQADLYSDQTLIIKDINLSKSKSPQTITIQFLKKPKSNEKSNIIFIKLEPIGGSTNIPN
ncbi:hypothetical protein DICPUDRAFT_26995 [Dictyostelium purpureum]|uniref:Uncharacterized protein n=1 Tax=Dictyostelium purpureum TaxID=5786 RepID=F0Z9H0_DICPU|nr:uncharacterized protein DICPUDRAFT_26995 [Dictyostelium purpureum]EGC39379.1 hypothetical protein DICPUDRAFT_26995 [Dictyostelium purpureum]|eukprot:XP_003284053.1 hypothetical protein DICPUDRAFT_26995 [Dictyostelium purpureum]